MEQLTNEQANERPLDSIINFNLFALPLHFSTSSVYYELFLIYYPVSSLSLLKISFLHFLLLLIYLFLFFSFCNFVLLILTAQTWIGALSPSIVNFIILVCFIYLFFFFFTKESQAWALCYPISGH